MPYNISYSSISCGIWYIVNYNATTKELVDAKKEAHGKCGMLAMVVPLSKKQLISNLIDAGFVSNDITVNKNTANTTNKYIDLSRDIGIYYNELVTGNDVPIKMVNSKYHPVNTALFEVKKCAIFIAYV